MTRTTNARLAGIAYLFYIAVAFPDMRIWRIAMRGEGIAAKLANVAQHSTNLRGAVILELLSGVSALVLAVTLHAITRDEDPDVAMLGLASRVGEGITNVIGIPMSLTLIWLATATGPGAPDAATTQTLATYLLHEGPVVGAFLFALGSTAFCWLLLRGRMIPSWLAWVGFVGSALLVVSLPLEFAQFIRGPITQFVWLPIAVFEIVVAFLFIIKGVRAPPPRGALATA